jgi:outer membrane receptor protein involved in Fe transport
MRRATLMTLSSSVSFATLAMMASPAVAQTEGAQTDAQQANDQVECSAIADAAQRQACIDTQGETAPAETGAPAADTIVVTGSRIARPNFDTIQPSTVLNSAAIEQRGFVNAADALNELPQFGIPGSSPVGAGQGGSFGTGQSFVNFLGLGSQRTLVLVNGRRFISSNTSSIFGPTASGGQVDIGQINTKLIDRIETIAIGGAPIYGSDAIAGTINILLKRDFEGIDIDAQDGISDRGDAHNYRVRAIAGRNFLDGRANLTVSAEYNKGKGLTYNDRKVTSRGLFYAACDPGSQFNQCIYTDGPRVNATPQGGAPLVFDIFALTPQQRALFGIPASVGVTDATGNELIFNGGGQLTPAQYGLNPGGDDNFSFFAQGGNGFAYIRDTSQLLSDTERYNVNLIGHVELTDNVRVFGEAWFAHSKSTNLQTQPEYNSAAFGSPGGDPSGNLIFSVDNPFLTTTQRDLIIAAINNNFSDQNVFGVEQDYFYLSRANTDLSSGRSTYADDVYRGVLGIDGKFDLMAGQWRWEAVGNYGVSDAIGKATAINTQNFFNALDAVRDDSGNIVCRPGYTNSPFPTLSSTCAPLNLFGSGLASQEAIDYVLSQTNSTQINKQFVATADVSGPLFNLPGGDLSIALGAEYRRESTDNRPSGFYNGPDEDTSVDEDGDGDATNDLISYGQGSPIIPIKANFHTNEVFAELNADIVSPNNDIAFVHNFDIQAAARYVDHSIAGGDLTWTVGSRYSPVRDIAFRGNFTRAIRSPSLQEVFIPTSTFFNFAVDPCDRDQLENGPDPATRAANCAAEGIPADFQSNADDASFLQSTGGNPELKNEKSDAYSFGGVLTPSFFRGFSLSADYISVKLKDAISNFTASQVLDACYDSADPASNPFCDLITRNPADDPDAAFSPSFIATSYFNAAKLRYRGIVVAFDYKAKTPFLGAQSSIGIGGSYQRLLELTTVNTAGAAKTNNDGTLGYPKDSWVANINYFNGPVSLFTNFNYTGKVTQGVDEADDFREHQNLKSVIFTNAGFRIDVGDRFRFFGDVDNLFDVKPPYPVPAFGGAVTYFPGVMGRYFRFGAGVHF